MALSGAWTILVLSAQDPGASDAGGRVVVVREGPDPEIGLAEEVRARVAGVGAPWRIRDAESGIEFVLVPAGTYWRGGVDGDRYVVTERAGPAAPRVPETPRHQVRISTPFYIARTEVSVAQFAYLGRSVEGASAGFPIEVSHEVASRFCTRRGFRLPTEAEWEYAARAGVESSCSWGDEAADGSRWVNGSDRSCSGSKAAAWPRFPFDDGHPGPAPVEDASRANAFGLVGVLGNAAEWCADAYDPEAYERATVDPVDPIAFVPRTWFIVRGGSHRSGPADCRLSARFASSGVDEAGFRVVWAVEDVLESLGRRTIVPALGERDEAERQRGR
jgi:formylglycine-generating enzyme required for sulfatase activity